MRLTELVNCPQPRTAGTCATASTRSSIAPPKGSVPFLDPFAHLELAFSLSTGLSPAPRSLAPPTTAYGLLPAAYSLLPTAYCLLPTAYCLLPTTHCLLSNSSSPSGAPPPLALSPRPRPPRPSLPPLRLPLCSFSPPSGCIYILFFCLGCVAVTGQLCRVIKLVGLYSHFSLVVAG
jgi:hypothetical protein